MLSKNHSVTGTGGGYKKKKAPPRPPPPAGGNNVRPSQSFKNASELHSQKMMGFGQRPSYSVDSTGVRKGPDLIDFSTPPESPEHARRSVDFGVLGDGRSNTISKEPQEYFYRVGASIFYVKSHLKNQPAPNQTANPFSPPRPSAQAMMASPAKQPSNNGNGRTLYGNVPFPQQGSQASSDNRRQYNPTIIRAENSKNLAKPAGVPNWASSAIESGSVRSSSGSSDWSDFSQTSQPQQRYGNVPNAPIATAWDEPPAQHRAVVSTYSVSDPFSAPTTTTSSVSYPTIIKPPISTKPSLLPKPNLSSGVGPTTSGAGASWKTAASAGSAPEVKEERNYYDEPPDSDFETDEEDTSFVSPPMPSEPPPPPPTDVALQEWVDSTDPAASHMQSHGREDTSTDRAYAIVLYDYISDVEGDLPVQVGDLVYLIKRIDDSWLYGHCAGVEGMFPTNYVNIVVPLPEESEQLPDSVSAEPTSIGYSSSSSQQVFFADAIYKFDAEADGDLTLRPGDMVKIFGRLNDDWLYGEVAGSVGQFPANFVEPVPSDLPIIPIPTE